MELKKKRGKMGKSAEGFKSENDERVEKRRKGQRDIQEKKETE